MGTKHLAIFGWISPEFILKSVKSSMQHGTSTKVAVLQMFYSLWSDEQWKTPLLVKGDDILPSYKLYEELFHKPKDPWSLLNKQYNGM